MRSVLALSGISGVMIRQTFRWILNEIIFVGLTWLNIQRFILSADWGIKNGVAELNRKLWCTPGMAYFASLAKFT
ncbi:hypothetical protein X777_00774 [Ooceraea biroi]|uniref:Uncharacterized protein n=1 Tax=Ooceraea biroi TaxID=2015173 RepID=A0A026WRF5_OOCBI|nr:hypothetical protein X777_00774 [Ooceraea biroi]